MIKSIIIALCLICSSLTAAPKFYWIASSTSNWNNNINWSSTSGGINDVAAAPAFADIAVFDGNGQGNCNLDIPIAIAGIEFKNTYNGTFIQNNNLIAIGYSEAIFSGGTFQGSGNFQCKSDFTINGATFNAPAPIGTPVPTIDLWGNVSFLSGTFNHNNGFFNIIPSSLSIVTGSTTFYNLSVFANNTNIKFLSPYTVNSNFTASCYPGNITLDAVELNVLGKTRIKKKTTSSSGAFIFKSGVINAKGDISVDFTGDPMSNGTGTINVCGTGAQTFTTQALSLGQGILSNVTINKPSGLLTLSGKISLFGTWNYVTGLVDTQSANSTVAFVEGNIAGINGGNVGSNMVFNNLVIGVNGVPVTAKLIGNLWVYKSLTISTPISGNCILNATTNGYKITIGGNFNGLIGSQFIPGNSTVEFNGVSTAVQSVELSSYTASNTLNVFNNLTINTNGIVKLNTNNLGILNTFNMLKGNLDLNNFEVTLGQNATSNGVLNRTGGWLYGGKFTRWLSTAAPSIPSDAGLFPFGLNKDYCPFWLGGTSSFSSGGTVSVAFNYNTGFISPFTPFTDASWMSSLITSVTNSYWDVSSANGFLDSGNNINIRHGGGNTTFDLYTMSDVGSSLTTTVTGNYVPSSAAIVQLEANRSGLNAAKLNNIFRLSSQKLPLIPLAIDLLSFSAIMNNNKVDIKWETSVEKNNYFFTIEKSKNGANFEQVMDVVSAKKSNDYMEYFESDFKPYSGISYYRLKLIDKNKKISYSPIVTVFQNSDKSMKVYPNPSKGFINMQLSGFESQEVVIVIRDMKGSEYFTKIVVNCRDSELVAIDQLNIIPPGVYIIIASSNNLLFSNKLIIQ